MQWLFVPWPSVRVAFWPVALCQVAFSPGAVFDISEIRPIGHYCCWWAGYACLTHLFGVTPKTHDHKILHEKSSDVKLGHRMVQTAFQPPDYAPGHRWGLRCHSVPDRRYWLVLRDRHDSSHSHSHRCAVRFLTYYRHWQETVAVAGYKEHTEQKARAALREVAQAPPPPGRGRLLPVGEFGNIQGRHTDYSDLVTVTIAIILVELLSPVVPSLNTARRRRRIGKAGEKWCINRWSPTFRN